MTDASYPDTVINGVPVVATPAEIDLSTADQLRAALVHAALVHAGQDGHRIVVVDMTGTSFCDSAGIHVLAAAHKRARAGGGELRVVLPPGGAVPRLFALSSIDRFLPCFTRLEQALVP